jgi:hypothetical protein
MAGVQELNFDSPDETRTPDKTRVDVVRTGGATAAPGSSETNPALRSSSSRARRRSSRASSRFRVSYASVALSRTGWAIPMRLPSLS